MARGIEELAEMQVTGPVQGGDMVMKPDQAPVGAAALLNKMSRQNTPGIFKLPMPDKQMPDFMKVAAEGVEQQTAKGDSINKMAGQLMRQGIDIRGMGMDEIITIYEQIFGSPGDVDQFGVSENLFPGNFTNKEQDVTLLPRNLKTGPDNPETELAYITDDEKALLALMNPGTPHEGPEGVPTYDVGDYVESGWGFLNDDSGSSNDSSGSSSGNDDVSGLDYLNPSSGSSSANDVESDWGFLNDDSDHSPPASDDTSSDPVIDWADDLEDYDIAEDIQSGYGTPYLTPGESEDVHNELTNLETIYDNLGYDSPFIPTNLSDVDPTTNLPFTEEDEDDDDNNNIPEEFQNQINALNNLLNNPKKTGKAQKLYNSWTSEQKEKYSSFIPKLSQLSTGGGKAGSSGEDDKTTKDEDLESFNKWLLKTFGKGIISPGMLVAGGIGKMIQDFKVTPEKLQSENYLAIIKDKYLNEDGSVKEGREKEYFDFKDKYASQMTEAFGKVDPVREFEARLKGATAPEGSEAERRINPKKYWENKSAQTMGDLERLSTVGLTGDKNFDRRIIEAREAVSKQRDAQETSSGGGGGGPVEKKITEEVAEETTTTNPLAGAFNVGGTMPYTHDVATAGVETDVPLGRRFQVDKTGKYLGSNKRSLEDMYKYATLGGYNQLEPFQQYLARRRKYLDEDEPQWFDEDGNVIYSGVT